MESRLDVLMFRLHLVPSIRMARQIILHGNVTVNFKIIKKSGYNLKENDFLSFKPEYIKKTKKMVYLNLKKEKRKTTFKLITPNYVECS